MKIFKALQNENTIKLFLFITLICLFFIDSWGGFDKVFLDSDLGRDLSEMSKFWTGTNIIWLGPRLSPGLHASPIYYYLYYPAIWFTQGNAHSLIIFNILLGISTLGVLGIFSVRKWKINGLLPVLFIGLSPLFLTHITHPGNGYSYIIFILAFVTFLWFEFPLIIASLFLGLATSFHPAAIFGLPILVYEWLRRKHKPIDAILIVLGLVIPWSPIILFEIITKGYMIRHWMENKQTGFLGLGINFVNVNNILKYIFVHSGIALVVLPFVAKFAQKRLRIWLILSLLGVMVFCFLSPNGYILGITSILLFIVSIALMQNKMGQIILGILVCLFLIKIFAIDPKPTTSVRSISKIKETANFSVKNLDKKNKIAVLSVLEKDAKVPQADDYRYFLRIQGYEVVETDQIAQANTLIMFIEEPEFDWKSWSTWEVEQFGEKKLIENKTIHNIRLVVFSHK